jgi:hypothetical protein
MGGGGGYPFAECGAAGADGVWGLGGTPPPPHPGVKYLDSITYVVLCLQNRHSKWVTGKIVFLKGLWVLMGKAPALAGAFLISSFYYSGLGGASPQTIFGLFS